MTNDRGIRLWIVRLLQWIHLRVFGSSMSGTMVSFLQNMGYFSFGTVIAGVFLFLFSVIAGRTLGAAVFGEYQLVLSVAGFFVLPMVLGTHTALIRYLAPIRSDTNAIRRMSGTAFLLVFALTLVCGALLLLLQRPLTNILHLDRALLLPAVLLAVALALVHPLKATVHALQRFALGSFLEIASAATIVGVLVLLLAFGPRTYLAPVQAQIAGASAVILIAALALRRFCSAVWSTHEARRLLAYGMFATLGLVAAFILANSDRLILNYFSSTTNVGVYAAYMNGATLVTSAVLQVFATVFFPVLCQYSDKRIILHKVHRVLTVSGTLLFGVNLGMIPLIIALFGSSFPLDLAVIPLLALSMSSFFGYQIYLVFMNAEGVRGVRTTTLLISLAALLNITLNVLLVPTLQIRGAVLSGTIVNALLFLALRRRAVRFALSESALVLPQP